ncbi:MAG: outer membrane beta-barrel protein [Phaeodactylibacter sp.]|nr:outer membrane beta-barrel protein [Phaeodactylibacter sp.]MCB9297792.1 outer membrane beta-barrel protein [Lewinellaceae bacterium]
MKRLFYITLVLSCLFVQLPFTGTAQSKNERYWKGGQLDARFGIGLISTFAADKARTVTPPLVAGADYLINEKVSVGFQFGYTAAEKTREVLGQKISWHNNFYTFSLRTGFHYTRISNWDVYGGLALSCNHSRISQLGEEKARLDVSLGVQESSSQFSYTAFLGSRYAVDKRMSLFAEAGFLTSFVTVGVGYRLL